MNRQEAAETLGLRALSWLVGNEEIFPVFLGASGVSAADLAAGANEPAFLGSVLDFLLTDESWVIGFCDDAGLPYDALLQARAALPGGEQINWT